MNKQQSGFTIIELVVVIVILGILAATALPKFVDLRDEAHAAAADGFAGGLASANAVNYAGCLATNGTAKVGTCTAIAKCSDIGLLMNPAVTFTVGVLPASTVSGTMYIVTDTALTTAGASCTFTYGTGKTTGISRSFFANATS